MASARRTWLLLGALTALGAALRLPFLGLQSLWYDETFTAAVVEQPTLGALWDQVRLTESTPPLYYVITWAWAKLAGSTGDAALRAPAAVAGVFCVPAAYLALRRLAEERAALAAATMTAVSPVLVAYSLNARAYPLLVLLACLSVWAMAELLERRGTRWLAAWALLAAALLWTHYYAAFLVGAELGVLLWRLAGARARVLAAGAAVAVAAAPLLPLLADQRDERASNIESLGLGERVEQAVRQLAAGANPPSRPVEWLAILLCAAGLAAGAWRAARDRSARVMAALAAATALTPLLLDLTGIDDHFFMRNLLVAWAPLAGLAALGLTRARAIPLAAVLLAFAALTIATHADWRHHNADWEGALAELGPRTDGVPVVVLPGFDSPVANRYLGRAGASRPLLARSVWVVVAPARKGRAELAELPGYPRAAPPGFRPTVTRTHHGFRMILLEAGAEAPLDPAAFGPDQLEGRAVLLAPR
ncbi:MAG TPA: glycosyltransferase family 39 protein [Thermoleophilaceae bacterium]